MITVICDLALSCLRIPASVLLKILSYLNPDLPYDSQGHVTLSVQTNDASKMRHLKSNQRGNLPFIAFIHIEMYDQRILIFSHWSLLHSCWAKFRVQANSVWESKVPLIGLKGKERECRVTPLGCSDSHKEAQITKVEEFDPAKAQQDLAVAVKSYSEVIFATLYWGGGS